MKKFTRYTAILLALIMTLALAGCGSSSKSGGKNVKVDDSKWHTEKLTAPGDVFELPEVKAAEGGPAIGELTKQVNPGNSITVSGEGFTGAKAYVYSQNEKGNGKADEAEVNIIDDTNMTVTLNSDLKYGVYGIYVESSKGKSRIALVNKPSIWWIGFTTLAAGDDINVYGENLTTENGEGTTYGYLVAENGKYRELEVKYADPYKVTFKMPEGLTDGEEYTIKLHNGHGGEEAWAEAPDKVKFSKNKVNNFTGKKHDVTDYGADPADDGKDDTTAVQKAVASASDGDIIYFPAGTYLINGSVSVEKSVSFLGVGNDSVIINGRTGNGGSNANFYIKQGPCEFNKLKFRDVRKGNFPNPIIEIESVKNTDVKNYELYVHNCKFIQYSKARSGESCIVAEDTDGVVIDNNSFEAVRIVWTNRSNRVFITNNDFCGNAITGPYYNQNATLFWTTNKVDASNNKFYGKDLLTDDSGNLSTKDDLTAGRAFAIQGFNYNQYISNNSMLRTGLPADNAGEQIMLENVNNVYNDKADSFTKNTVTIKKNISLASDYEVTITAGKGVGQVRYIKSLKDKTITLDKDWEILPDETSNVLITGNFHNYAIYKNTFDCFTNYAEKATATCAVQIYGSTFNCFITKNIMKNMAYGVCVTSHYKYSKKEQRVQNIVYWTNIDDNEISDVNIGIWHILAAVSIEDIQLDKIPMHTSLGVAERNNKISNITDFGPDSGKQGKGGFGILVGSYNIRSETILPGSWEFGTIIEKNTFANCARANVFLCRNQGGTVMLGNKVESGISNPYTLDSGADAPLVCK